jgi:hypothetical protein
MDKCLEATMKLQKIIPIMSVQVTLLMALLSVSQTDAANITITSTKPMTRAGSHSDQPQLEGMGNGGNILDNPYHDANGDGQLLPQPAPSGIWQPTPGTSWQWQLTGEIDTSLNVQMYDIDLFDVPQSVIDQLHAQGRVVICYFSAGSWEDWRPDAGAFSSSVKGDSNGWPGERWLDIRRLDILGPIVETRLNLALEKRCDGVEPDNVDGYTNDTGFLLTYQDQIAFNTFLANAAHQLGLSVGLKNDVEQVTDLLPYFDWALNEQCFQYRECDSLLPFIEAGKAVFQVEYQLRIRRFCPKANEMNFDSLKKREDLNAWRMACR